MKYNFLLLLIAFSLFCMYTLINFNIDIDRENEAVYIARNMIGKENLNILDDANRNDKSANFSKFWQFNNVNNIDGNIIRYTSIKNGFFQYNIYDSTRIEKKWIGH